MALYVCPVKQNVREDIFKSSLGRDDDTLCGEGEVFKNCIEHFLMKFDCVTHSSIEFLNQRWLNRLHIIANYFRPWYNWGWILSLLAKASINSSEYKPSGL